MLKSSLVVAARAKHGEGAAVTITYADGSTEVVPASWSTVEESGAMGGANDPRVVAAQAAYDKAPTSENRALLEQAEEARRLTSEGKAAGGAYSGPMGGKSDPRVVAAEAAFYAATTPENRALLEQAEEARRLTSERKATRHTAAFAAAAHAAGNEEAAAFAVSALIARTSGLPPPQLPKRSSDQIGRRRDR